MKRIAFTLLITLTGFLGANAQYELQKEDSLLALLRNKPAMNTAERVAVAFELLHRHVPNEPIFDSLKNILINDAETSRDRSLICEVYIKIAVAYLNIYQKKEYSQQAKFYIDNCLAIANESGLESYKVAALIKYAEYYRNLSLNQKALDYNNQAIALATSIGIDSLLFESYTSVAGTWEYLANKLSRFQALLTAREFAERSGKHSLITRNYIDIAAFYKETGQMEKCKDYYSMAIEKGRDWKQWYTVLTAMRGMGQAYTAERKKELVVAWYNNALALADSLGLEVYKVNIYLDLLNYYVNYETPESGLAYLRSHPVLMKFINDVGVSYQLNKLYAASKDHDKQYDSALYFMKIAAPYEYNSDENYHEKYQFTAQWADILKNMNDREGVKEKLLLAKSFADSLGDLNALQDISLQLDSAYLASADYKNAYYYYSRYNFYRDTLDALGRQKDLLNIEIENTNKRAEQQKLQETASLRQRDNIEYMGITAAIATLFILLVLFGVFKMSPAVIKALGFFAFIFLFEFITLLLDKQIHEITHGEPWEVLAIKIILIAMLLPLHHWLEEKVLRYLTSKAHKLRSGLKFFNRKPGQHTLPKDAL
jgi:tetratricopeptide (TPR) repeat protein